MGTKQVSKTAKHSYGSVTSSGRNPSDDDVHKDMMPSPNSTNSPSRENLAKDGDKNGDDETYRLINDNQDASNTSGIQMQPLRRKKSFEELLREHITGPHVRTRNLSFLVAVAATIGLSVWFLKSHPDRSWHSSTSKDGGDLLPYGPSKVTRAPFSKLDPVKDLGLHAYDRPKENKPARPLTKGLKNAKTFPTNAWYQSLLMPEGEPNVLHRANAIPYVVDAAGPMPGLRVHPNHIEASSFVVQLYLIEEYGLTLGAMADASVSKPSDKQAKEVVSHQYTVTHATPLGVTLEWVRERMSAPIRPNWAFFVGPR